MQYSIEGAPLPIVTCHLTRGESMITESGGMSWMSDGISMSTNMNGGLGKGIGRMFAGESMFQATYTCEAEQGFIAFASCFAGNIIPFELDGTNSVIVQKTGFLAGQSGINIEIFFQQKLGAGLFGGEGFIMQKLTGKGIVFIEIDGHCVKKELAHGEILKVDSGHAAAFTSSVRMDIERIKGFKNVFFGGEGLFNTILTGPGVVWLQSMPAKNMAKSIIPYIPSGK